MQVLIVSLARGTGPVVRWLSVLPVWPILASLLIMGSAAVHVAYLASDRPLDLAQDEAHYWDWSRHLDWSYYSKGPIVAYLIRGGCALAGDWSRRLTGSEMLAVRLPAVVCGSLLLWSLYALTRRIYAQPALATSVVALALGFPVVAVGSSLMTIDAPYTCCWGWALVLGHQAIFRRSAWAWPVAGLVVGIGILAKYTMVLWLPSVGLFLLFTSSHRHLLMRPGFWIMTAAAALCCLPILIWNVQHDWISFRHVHSLAGLKNGPTLNWRGPIIYLATQFFLLFGFWFVAWVRALLAHRPWSEPRADLQYLWWLSVPMFAVFLLFSLKTGGGEPNWPVTTYLAGMVLAAGWLVRQMQSSRTWYRRTTKFGVGLASSVGILLAIAIHRSEWFMPVLTYLAGPPSAKDPYPLRRLDPTCRLKGWHTLAAEVDRIGAKLRSQGIEPVVVGTNWSLPGELGFYCEGHPTVYSLGLLLGDRHSQYDLWRPNPIDDAQVFAGRTFIIVGYLNPEMCSAFERIEMPLSVELQDAGQPIGSWVITVCHGFQGFTRQREREGDRY